MPLHELSWFISSGGTKKLNAPSLRRDLRLARATILFLNLAIVNGADDILYKLVLTTHPWMKVFDTTLTLLVTIFRL